MDERNRLDKEQMRTIGQAIIDKLQDPAQEAPYFVQFPEHTAFINQVWNSVDAEGWRRYLTEQFNTNSLTIGQLLEGCRRSHPLTDEGLSPAEAAQAFYHSLKSHLDLQVVHAALLPLLSEDARQDPERLQWEGSAGEGRLVRAFLTGWSAEEAERKKGAEASPEDH
jgi:hypothetical protein